MFENMEKFQMKILISLKTVLVVCACTASVNAAYAKMDLADLQAATDATKNLCLSGHQYDLTVNANGSLEIKSLKPGAHLSSEITRTNGNGAVDFKNEEFRVTADKNILDCIGENFPKILQALAPTPQSQLIEPPWFPIFPGGIDPDQVQCPCMTMKEDNVPSGLGPYPSGSKLVLENDCNGKIGIFAMRQTRLPSPNEFASADVFATAPGRDFAYVMLMPNDQVEFNASGKIGFSVGALVCNQNS